MKECLRYTQTYSCSSTHIQRPVNRNLVDLVYHYLQIKHHLGWRLSHRRTRTSISWHIPFIEVKHKHERFIISFKKWFYKAFEKFKNRAAFGMSTQTHRRPNRQAGRQRMCLFWQSLRGIKDIVSFCAGTRLNYFAALISIRQAAAPGTLLSIRACRSCFLPSLFKHAEEVTDYSPETSRGNTISVLSHMGLHKLFADSYLLTRSLPWHYSPISSIDCRRAAAFFLTASSLLQLARRLLLHLHHRQRAPGHVARISVGTKYVLRQWIFHVWSALVRVFSSSVVVSWVL